MRSSTIHRRVQRAWASLSESVSLIAIAAGGSLALIAEAPVMGQCQKQFSVAGDAASGDQFGFSVAMSGNVCVVGSRLDDAGAINSGSAYVFRYSPLTGIWVQEAKLSAPDAATNDEFGFSVAVESSPVTGDVVVVSARHDDDKGVDSGSAYFFKKMGTTWTQVSKVTASDGAAGDRFGFAVAIAGTHAIITSREDDAPNTNTGSAYAFHFNGTAWTQYVKLVPSDAASNDHFGHSAAVILKSDGTGAFAIIGAWRDDAPLSNSGSAYIYSFGTQSGTWNQQAKLTASDGASNDEFGNSVAISATTSGYVAIVGARSDDVRGNADAGSAYIFQKVGSVWQQQAKLTASDGLANDQFGESVAISGNGAGVLIGANSNDQGGLNAGAAYVFVQEIQDQTWSEAGKLLPSGVGAGDQCGGSVAAGVDRGAVGCQLNDAIAADSGSVIFYAGISGVDNNGNGLADGCDLPGDINGDGMVDITDLTIIITTWGMCPTWPAPCGADLDGNGSVDVSDLIIVVNNWS